MRSRNWFSSCWDYLASRRQCLLDLNILALSCWVAFVLDSDLLLRDSLKFYLKLLLPIPFHVLKHPKTLIRALDLSTALLFPFFFFKGHDKGAFGFDRLIVFAANADHCLGLTWTLPRVVVVAWGCRVWEVAATFAWWLNDSSAVDWGLADFANRVLSYMSWLAVTTEYLDTWAEIVYASHRHPHIVHLLIGATLAWDAPQLIIYVRDGLLLRILLNALQMIICAKRISDNSYLFVLISYSTL